MNNRFDCHQTSTSIDGRLFTAAPHRRSGHQTDLPPSSTSTFRPKSAAGNPFPVLHDFPIVDCANSRQFAFPGPRYTMSYPISGCDPSCSRRVPSSTLARWICDRNLSGFRLSLGQLSRLLSTFPAAQHSNWRAGFVPSRRWIPHAWARASRVG